MAQNLESNFSIRNLLAGADGTNPAITPPPSDGSLSPNISLSSNEENHGSRPNLTYSALVTMAIRSSPQGKLTLNAIQNWISENFPFYRKDEQGWQSQIRQTLSTNSCFLKVPRALDDPGRGNYWALSSELPAVGTVGVGNGSAIGALCVGHPGDGRGNYWALSSELPAVRTASVGNGSAIGALINGVPHPQAPNAVYFPTPHEVQGAHQTQLVQALHEQHACYQYHLQQTQLLQQPLFILQQQQAQQHYQDVYQKLMFHQQQVEFLTSQQISA
ncbi:forkhead box protein A2-B-like [Zeugodacus cucurbitae]|uniref:forkhead box protein A2-B-like n=1 Tax=Zeugodacus cucurbitae TaxID=28588 RepID=UPI0023D90275|nr:forkhead box protein A2-B-like [Zeugodacus cucurbitae]